MGNSVNNVQFLGEENAQILSSQAKSAQAAGSGSDKISQENVLLYVVILLSQSVGIQSDASVIKAKQMQANASQQIQVEKQEENVTWKTIPDKKTTKVKYVKSTHDVCHRSGPFVGDTTWHDTVDYGYRTQTINASSIDQANAQNFNGNVIRQALQGKISILQQNAGISETDVSELVQFSNESTQKASYVLSLIEDLTNKALMQQ